MLIYKYWRLSAELKVFGRASKQQGFIDIVAETIRSLSDIILLQK